MVKTSIFALQHVRDALEQPYFVHNSFQGTQKKKSFEGVYPLNKGRKKCYPFKIGEVSL